MEEKRRDRDIEAAKDKWLELWSEVGERVLRLPREVQEILLSDFQTAIDSRLMVMEKLCRNRLEQKATSRL